MLKSIVALMLMVTACTDPVEEGPDAGLKQAETLLPVPPPPPPPPVPLNARTK